MLRVDAAAVSGEKMPSRTVLARQETSAPGFRGSRDRLTPLLGANAAGDFKLKPVLIYYSENSQALKNYATSPLPVLYKRTTRPGRQHLCLQHSLPEICSPLLRPAAQKKKIPLERLPLVDFVPGQPRALMTYGEISVVFMPADTASILQPTEQGVILTLKSYYLRDTLHKAADAVDGDSSARAG